MSVVFSNCLVMVTLVIQRRFSLLYSHRMPFCRNKVKWNCDIVMFGYCWGGLKLRKARYCAIGRGQDHEESLSRVFQFIKQNALEMGLGRLPNFKKNCMALEKQRTHLWQRCRLRNFCFRVIERSEIPLFSSPISAANTMSLSTLQFNSIPSNSICLFVSSFT